MNEPDRAPSEPGVSEGDAGSPNDPSAERVRVLKAATLGFAVGLVLARWAARHDRQH